MERHEATERDTMTTIHANSSAARTVLNDLKDVQTEQDWLSKNKGTASKEDIATHAAAAEKDWEKFTADAAGLQQSGDPNDKAFALQSYTDAAKAFRSTQADLKEILGGRLNGDLQSGDATARDIQSQTSALIDQGNAALLHAQQLLNENGANAFYGNTVDRAGNQYSPVAGGTASPNNVSNQAEQIFDSHVTGFAPRSAP